MLRKVARKIGVGKAALKARQIIRGDRPIRHSLLVAYAKSTQLPKILSASPYPTGGGNFSVHMLLNHTRKLEGLWALYTFALHSQTKFDLVIHSDGTLNSRDIHDIHRLFPGTRVVHRDESDALTRRVFKERQLKRCQKFRDGQIFGIKLFDPALFTEHQQYLLLDSDVMFFSEPTEIVADMREVSSAPKYQLDGKTCHYALNDEQLAKLLGKACLPRVNPGILRAKKNTLDFERIEEYLAHPSFWNAEGKGVYMAELTIWALEMTLAGGRPLDPTYKIAPELHPSKPCIAGHYCGGFIPNSRFYLEALPLMLKGLKLGNSTR